MPGKNADYKAQLMTEGGQARWDCWWRRRDALRVQGMSSKDAGAQATAELPPVDPNWNGGGSAGPGNTQAGSPPPISGAAAPPLPDQLRSVFEGKQASDRDCVRWVARNLGVSDPDPATCPDPLAWSMLQYARMYPAGFWERVFPKIMPKTGAEDNSAPFTDDGREDLKIAEALRSAQLPPGSDEA